MHVVRRGEGPLVVLLHGRGADENDMTGLAGMLPQAYSYASVRGPIPEGDGYAWFDRAGVGRPVPESLREQIDWFREWLDAEEPGPVRLVGFSGGAAFAGGLLLDDPARWAGVAVTYGTLPFDAGVPTTPGHLAGVPVFVARGEADDVIPRDLLDRTWAYLHDESGADVTSFLDPGGHGFSAACVAALRAWLS